MDYQICILAVVLVCEHLFMDYFAKPGQQGCVGADWDWAVAWDQTCQELYYECR